MVLSLREPLPLRTLAEAQDVLDHPESLLDRARFDRLLEILQRLWSRGYADTNCVVVKATSSAARVAPALLSQSAATRGIYLNVAAEPYLATLLAGQNSPIDLRGHAAERIVACARRIETPLTPIHALSLGELAAMSWLAESLTQREALERHPERMLGVDFDRFLEDLPGGLQRVLAHLALPADDERWTDRAQPRPDTIFQGAGASVRTAPCARESSMRHGATTARSSRAGMRWLEQIAKTDAAAAALTRCRLGRRPHPHQVLPDDVEPHAILPPHRVAFERGDLVQLVDLHTLVLIGDEALDERDSDQALARAYRHHLVQERRRVDDGLPGKTLERHGLVARHDRELAALVRGGVAHENRAGQVRAETRGRDLDDRRIRMGAVFHAGLVAAQERRRDALRHREVDELPRAHQSRLQHLDGLRVLCVPRIRLQIVLRDVRRVRHPPLDETQLARQLAQSADLRRPRGDS